MSLRVGLGASQADLDVQGEIDFDFFEESDSISNTNKTLSETHESATTSQPGNLRSYVSGEYTGDCIQNSEADLKQHDPNISNDLGSCSSRNFNKPLITVSCDDKTGVIQKTMIETVIPTPFNYKESKCGKVSPSDSRKGKRLLSPRLKSKIFNDDNEISDDSSISSMSESDSDVSSVSADSFELNDGTDSMTDVSPLMSPYQCCTPVPDLLNETDDKTASPSASSKNSKKEGVKFTDDVERKECPKCDAIDLHELLKAVKRLEMGQNINSVGQEKISNPSVITQNARCRKNLSFSNEEVRRIDNENQILLKKIIAQQNRTKARSGTARVLSSSAVNRQRQQRQIELENLALLRRLETTKPSRDVSRSHLLRDYQQRSSGLLSRASSRSSKSCSSSAQASCRTSAQSSGRSSAISIKSSSSSASQSCSLPSANKA